jgi:hypothetical protein
MKTRMDAAIEEFLKHDKRTEVVFCESYIVGWFEKNFRSLGFEKILKKQHNKTPDFIVLKNGKEVKVEIEFKTSNFIDHKHKISEADYVVCCIKDVELDKSIQVISLNHILISYHDEIYPSIDPSKKIYTSDDLRFITDFWDKPKEKSKDSTKDR